jgi:hypothetical protein
MEWKRRGNGVIESAARALEENETLTVMFLDAAKTSSLSEKWKRKIMSALIMKVLHARSAAEHDKYKEQHTNREAKGATASSFRGELKVLTKGALWESKRLLVEANEDLPKRSLRNCVGKSNYFRFCDPFGSSFNYHSPRVLTLGNETIFDLFDHSSTCLILYNQLYQSEPEFFPSCIYIFLRMDGGVYPISVSFTSLIKRRPLDCFQ